MNIKCLLSCRIHMSCGGFLTLKWLFILWCAIIVWGIKDEVCLWWKQVPQAPWKGCPLFMLKQQARLIFLQWWGVYLEDGAMWALLSSHFNLQSRPVSICSSVWTCRWSHPCQWGGDILLFFLLCHSWLLWTTIWNVGLYRYYKYFTYIVTLNAHKNLKR